MGECHVSGDYRPQACRSCNGRLRYGNRDRRRPAIQHTSPPAATAAEMAGPVQLVITSASCTSATSEGSSAIPEGSAPPHPNGASAIRNESARVSNPRMDVFRAPDFPFTPIDMAFFSLPDRHGRATHFGLFVQSQLLPVCPRPVPCVIAVDSAYSRFPFALPARRNARVFTLGRSNLWVRSVVFRRTPKECAMSRSLAWLQIASLACCLLAAQRASAQSEGFALNRFEPSERGSDWFVLESLDLRGHPRLAAGLVFDYADKPLVPVRPGRRRGRQHRQEPTLRAYWRRVVFWDRARFALNLPIALFQNGENGRAGVTDFSSDNATTLGDLRVGADVRLAGTYGEAFTLAAGAQFQRRPGRRTRSPATAQCGWAAAGNRR